MDKGYKNILDGGEYGINQHWSLQQASANNGGRNQLWGRNSPTLPYLVFDHYTAKHGNIALTFCMHATCVLHECWSYVGLQVTTHIPFFDIFNLFVLLTFIFDNSKFWYHNFGVGTKVKKYQNYDKSNLYSFLF